VSAAAPNIQVCASKVLIGIQPISAQIETSLLSSASRAVSPRAGIDRRRLLLLLGIGHWP
jgi:hypothetical protein